MAEAIEAWLVQEIAARIGASAEEIDIRTPFAQYGLDSAEAVGLSGDLEVWLGLRLPPTLAWDYPTIEALSAHLAELPASKATLAARADGKEMYKA